MALINDLSVSVDNILSTYVQVIFEGVAEPIRLLLGAMALLALMLLAVNHLVQFTTINYASYFHWFLRYILIYSFATIWSNFEGIYNIFISVPNDYTALMIKNVANGIENIQTLRTDILDPAHITNTATGMDEFGHAIVWMAYDFLRDTSINDIGMSLKNVFTGIVILVVGGIFTASCALLVLVSKIGFALAVSLAPLAIITLMMEQTKSHFEAWLRFTLGFVILPLLTASLMALVLYTAGEVLAHSKGSSLEKQLWLPFVFIMIAAVYLLLQIPSMASSLAGVTVAAVGTGAGFAAAKMAMSAPSTAKQLASTAKQLTSKAYSGGQRLRDAAGVAYEAHKSGASPARTAWSAISGMRQSAMMRQQRRDQRLSGRIAGHNGPNSAARRYYGDSSGGGGSADKRHGRGSGGGSGDSNSGGGGPVDKRYSRGSGGGSGDSSTSGGGATTGTEPGGLLRPNGTITPGPVPESMHRALLAKIKEEGLVGGGYTAEERAFGRGRPPGK